ncbi:MAG: hypothetical protein HUU21_21145 [Polyangiaceae bacterium]|nr:hypothetical protein [Polyangiaceae bacterium]
METGISGGFVFSRITAARAQARHRSLTSMNNMSNTFEFVFTHLVEPAELDGRFGISYLVRFSGCAALFFEGLWGRKNRAASLIIYSLSLIPALEMHSKIMQPIQVRNRRTPLPMSLRG